MKERILRALGILFAVALIAGGILTAVFAEEAPTVSIEYFTLSHENAVYIEYAVDYRGFDGVPGNTGMLYWTKEPVKPELGTEDSRSGMLGYDEINGQKYYIFKYANLTAAQMCDDIWACAYATVDGTTYYSNVEKYSVETYAARKLGLVPGVEGTKDETLKDLLRAMLEYGEKAQKHFKDARQDIYPTDILHPVTVTFDADNGTTPTAQTVWRNRKPAKPADPTKDGYTFAGWRNGNTEWNFDTDTVTGDVTLTAHWNVAIRYSEGLSFDSNGDGTCSVSGIGTCTDADLVIPPVSPAEERVTAIGFCAFEKCNQLTSVVIPNSVIGINYRAFRNCINLTYATLPDSITNIGISAFHGCTKLKELTIPSSVTSIGSGAFEDCTAWEYVEIPNSVTNIGDGILKDCSNLKSATISNNLTSIPKNTFKYCENLSDILIPNNITSIGNGAFEYCRKLSGIVIPSGVTTIRNDAFSNCSNLTYIEVAEGNVAYRSTGNCLIETQSKTLIAGCKKSEIPSDGSVTSIGSYAFSGRSSLTSIAIPDSITSIGYYAFGDCIGLTSITIPNSVTSIGGDAFRGCINFVDISVPFVGNIPSGTSHTFFGFFFGAIDYTYNASYVPKSLKNVIVTGNVKIDENAFYGLGWITVIQKFTVTFDSNGGEAIPPQAVKNGQLATKPEDPVKEGYAFAGWYNGNKAWNFDTDTVTEGVTLTARWTEIPTSKGLKYTSNGDGTCYLSGIGSCKDSDLNIPSKSPAGDRVTGIGNWAFDQCRQLTSVIIPDSMTTIGERAFNGCSNLTYVVIPNSVTSIGVYAFAYCNLEEIAFPDSVTQIGDDILNSCNNLKRITVDPNNPVYRAAGNCLIDRRNGVLLVGCQNSVIPTDGSVTSIYVFAFYKCEGLKSIVIPKGVTSIGYEAFYYCTNLTSVTISDSVTSFAFEAFRGCSNLTTINYEGTMEQWNSIEKADSWDKFIDSYTVHCTDGDIVKS